MNIKDLDKWYKPCGPCAFCGFHDKRHRMWDAFCGMHRAGDSVETIARWYEEAPEYVQAVIDIQPYQKRVDTTLKDELTNGHKE